MKSDPIEQHYEAIRALAALMAPHTRALWIVGDGNGGGILAMIASAAGIDYFDRALGGGPARQKAKISRSLSKRVFERDGYRCVTCGGHIDLTCDHVTPESLGGPTTYENLQTMCRPCNSKKGVRVG